MSLQKAFSVVGLGWTGAFLYSQTHLVSEFLKNAVTGLLAGRPGAGPEVSALAEALSGQSAQVSALLAAQAGRGGSVDSLSSSTALNAMIATGVGLLALRTVDLGAYLPVTRGAYKAGQKTISAALGFVQNTLVRVRDELSARLQTLEGKVDGVASDVAASRAEVEELGRKIMELAEKQELGNNGIFLLCNVVTGALKDQGQPAKQEPIKNVHAPSLTIQEQLESISRLALAIQNV